MENFKFWDSGMGLKIFGPKYQKAHPYAKSGRINCVAYVEVMVFKRYTAARKKVRDNCPLMGHGNHL